jgi:hypothetical protein
MARPAKKGRLEEAMATLLQNQAALVANQTAFVARMAAHDAEMAELKREIAETNRENAQRFARIEALLIEHGRILQALPDVIRDKIGFRVPPADK